MSTPRLPPSLDPEALPDALPKMRYWFRYPLHRHDFHALHPPPQAGDGALLGYYSAKPLYGNFDPKGFVDRGSGYNGDIAGVFVPSPARSWAHADLFFTHIEPARVARADGRRNWPVINAAAQRELWERLGFAADRNAR